MGDPLLRIITHDPLLRTLHTSYNVESIGFGGPTREPVKYIFELMTVPPCKRMRPAPARSVRYDSQG
jgi:transketolase